MKSTCSFCQYLCYSKKKKSKGKWRQLTCSPKHCGVLISHCHLSPKDIPERLPLPALPSLPSLKTCAHWQSARCAHTQETCPVSPSKAASHRLRRESRCRQPQNNFWGWGGGGEKMLLCVTLAGCLPSPLGKGSRPQLCLHTPTGYVTQCPTDIFPGRESEYEMIVLFTSYLLTLSVSRAAGSTDRAAFWQYGQCEGSVSRREERKNPGNPGLTCSCLWCSVTYCIL